MMIFMSLNKKQHQYLRNLCCSKTSGDAVEAALCPIHIIIDQVPLRRLPPAGHKVFLSPQMTDAIYSNSL